MSGANQPPPRASATIATAPGDRLIVFGGYNGSNNDNDDSNDFLNDLWTLHTVDEAGKEAFAWEQSMQPSGRRASQTVWPAPRSGHSIVTCGSAMLLFGGRSSAGRYNDSLALDTGETLLRSRRDCRFLRKRGCHHSCSPHNVTVTLPLSLCRRFDVVVVAKPCWAATVQAQDSRNGARWPPNLCGRRSQW